MKKKFLGISAALLCILSVCLLTSCQKSQDALQDGYYTAQAAEYNFGWKEYITIMVKDGKIVSAEYNAENASGFIKSWDNAYMKTMLHTDGTYPNEYTRYYSSQLLGAAGETPIDALSGATSSYKSFQKLMAAVIEQARMGDSSIVFVNTQD